MRAGNLDRVILIERPTTGIDVYGTPIKTWAAVATVRAQLLQYDVDNRETARGDVTERTVTFRIRWLDGLTLDNRVSFEGAAFTIKKIKEIGRRVGLDVICERVGP
jgi:SPP1 family predicted phage head-tail adaptor